MVTDTGIANKRIGNILQQQCRTQVYGLGIIFASALIVLALIININPKYFSKIHGVPQQPWSSLMGSVIGFFSTLMGIGGALMANYDPPFTPPFLRRNEMKMEVKGD